MKTLEILVTEKSFAQCLEENALPMPPMPEERLEDVREYYPNFFSTDPRDLLANVSTLSLVSLDVMFPPYEDTEKMDYFGCGLLGNGLQSWFFTYFLCTKNLEIAISLPWGNVYDDAKADKILLEKMYQLLEVCGAYIKPDKVIRFVVDVDHIEWEILNAQKEVLQCGQELKTLLDALMLINDVNMCTKSQSWLKA